MTWKPTSELCEVMNDGEQLDILFCGTTWGWPISGVVSYFQGELDYMEYDQINDKYREWTGELPTLYWVLPKVPKENS